MESIKINQDEVVIQNINKFPKKVDVSSILNKNFRYFIIFLFLFLFFIIYQLKNINELKRTTKNINGNKIGKNI